jgi:hypothetical protein
MKEGRSGKRAIHTTAREVKDAAKKTLQRSEKERCNQTFEFAMTSKEPLLIGVAPKRCPQSHEDRIEPNWLCADVYLTKYKSRTPRS